MQCRLPRPSWNCNRVTKSNMSPLLLKRSSVHGESGNPRQTRCAGLFIPTSVGNTDSALGARHSRTSTCGSSPQAWGTRRTHECPKRGFIHAERPGGTSMTRFIPTSVGNTSRAPDACAAVPARTGSSPQAWGTRRGKSGLATSVHPHKRGEHHCASGSETPVHPHKRGEHTRLPCRSSR